METKLKIKDSLYILEDFEGNYIFLSTATRRIKKFQVDSLVKDLVNLLELEIRKPSLIEELSKKYQRGDIESCINALEKEGIISRHEKELPIGKYYKQALFLDEITDSRAEILNLQNNLEKSVIGVFGIGGIGTWIVNGLSQIGIGEIRIVDPDIVSESNLNRQLFFTSNDVGKYKVEVIKEKLTDTKIIPFVKKVEPNSDLEGIIKGCNFLVNCADSPSISETTKIINSYASKMKGIPYCVSGGYNLHLGMVGPIIIPGKTKSFEDFLNYQKSQDPLKDFKIIRDIKDSGNIGPIAGAIANIQTMEIFKYLIGKGKLNINRFAEIDFMDLSVEWRDF